MDKEPITVSGLEELKKELNYLKNIKRQEIISAIQPRIFLPLQYSADESSDGQSSLGKFLSEMGTTDIEPQRRLNLTETNLPGELRVVTMEPTI